MRVNTIFCFVLFCQLGVIVCFNINAAREEWKKATPFREWKETGMTSEQMIKKLLANMTLPQKIRQLDQYKGNEFLSNGKLNVNMSRNLLSDGIGQIHDFYPPTASLANELQLMVLQLFKETGSPPIPIKFAEECLHGLIQGGHTCFPQSLALSSTWNSNLIHTVGKAIGSESRSYNIRECFAPVLGISRDPRWGRTEETYGEDQHLAGAIGHEFVKGIQLGNQSTYNRTITGAGSLIKHFITYSAPEGGRNTAPAHLGHREFLSDYAPSFYRSLSNQSCSADTEFCLSQASGTMGAYSERDGIPNCSDEWLLTDMLRGEWGFDGYVLGDLGAIEMLWTTHRVAQTPADSVLQFLAAGGNMQFYDYSHIEYKHIITKLIDEGLLTTESIDKRVSEVLRVKAKMGLFLDPFVDEDDVAKYVNSDENQEISLQASRESIILLKNSENILPLSASVPLRIALIGPNSDAPRVGDYSGRPDSNSTTTCNYVSIKEGISQFSDRFVSVEHLWGTGIQSNEDLLVVRPYYLYPTYPNQKSRATQQKCEEHGLFAEYYPSRFLDVLGGAPVLRRIDTQINFDWYHYSPDAPANSVPYDEFSVRWSGYLVPDIPKNITSSIEGFISMNTGGDPVRVYINEKLIIEQLLPSNDTSPFVTPFKFDADAIYQITIEYHRITNTIAQLQWSLYGNNGISLSAKLAARNDLAIVCIGEDESTSGENHDRTSLDLPGEQVNLLKAIYATGTPVIAIVISGRPLSIDWTSKNINTILQAFFPGQAGGQAIAEIIFGKVSPSAKLPISIPQNVGQLPMFYNYKPSARPDTYVGCSSSPLYPFGFGLSYTNFEYSNLSLYPQNISISGSVVVRFDVTNNGSRVGDEIVQLYVRDHVSSVTTAVKQLRGFKKLQNLQIDETRSVSFNISAANDLWLINRKYRKVVEPGIFTIWVGSNSADLPLNGTLLVHK